MVIKKAAFENTREEEDRKDDVFTVRVNADERAMLERMKQIFDTKQDSTALKSTFAVGYHVIHTMFGAPFAQYLFKKDRVRLTDYESVPDFLNNGVRHK